MRPTELAALVLQGMAMSTYFMGESVSQKAITGMLTYDASVMACTHRADTHHVSGAVQECVHRT